MNRADLYRSLGEIDDETLRRTEAVKSTRRSYLRLLPIAASITLLLCVLGNIWLSRGTDEKERLFVLTACAVDGERLELEEGRLYLNSGGTGENIFGVNEPLFSFTVNPAKYSTNPGMYAGCEISVFRDGKIVDSLRDQVQIFHLIPMPDSDAPYTYEIMGWTEDKMNLTIRITDENSGRLLEEITVDICRSTDSEEYQLTISAVKTGQSEESN